AFHGLGGGISKIFSPSKDCINSILKKDESLMPDLLTEESIQDAFLHKCDVIAIGPGLKPDEQKLNVQSLISMNKRIIIDSGGLESVKQISLNENVILTPHPGEFKRLIDATHSTTMDLLEQIRQYCLSCNVNLIYRGSFTILCNPRGDLYIWNYPNPKLAVMGTGDVFVGILSYFAAKKDSILDAFHLTMSAMEISRMMKGTYPSATEINTFINEVIHNG
ncbi:MAG: NAD(P)H-hydrate dehydratase, partial [Leptospiraceae bacterium]|nr:NAD(P)H-hydrate dehydratase [Leptospiraceae bacterium]